MVLVIFTSGDLSVVLTAALDSLWRLSSYSAFAFCSPLSGLVLYDANKHQCGGEKGVVRQ